MKRLCKKHFIWLSNIQCQVSVVDHDNDAVDRQIESLDCVLVRVHRLNLRLESVTHHQINTPAPDTEKELIDE
ncbi:hypothetical protein Pmani_030921 [Petrolisthes manimaculis]|uniref:Uncharacterized protein n=1 Tax=Petrolisthes manimaculis TaxID=1843537 RepID=A0AAE1TT47_9EUCA|nr:hypothetical protein Pmani_030921 [Petrolisthes manimaculis]